MATSALKQINNQASVSIGVVIIDIIRPVSPLSQQLFAQVHYVDLLAGLLSHGEQFVEEPQHLLGILGSDTGRVVRDG